MEYEPGGETRVLKPDSCFSIRVEPQCGQIGFRDPLTSNSESRPHDWQIYSKSGMGSGPTSRR
jgi:hypothetical protein